LFLSHVLHDFILSINIKKIVAFLNPDIAIEGKIELQKKRKTNKYAPFQ